MKSVLRLFGKTEGMGLVAVLLFGFALSYTYRSDSRDRGIEAAKTEATLLANTGVEPLLARRTLNSGITQPEHAALQRLTDHAKREQLVLRVRLRDASGKVLFSDDGSGLGAAVDDEVIDAVNGSTTALVTRLNADANDSGVPGARAIEVYVPVDNGFGEHIGAL